MLMQSSLPSSIEAALFHVSDKGKEDALCDWIPSAETWQVCLKCKRCPLTCCRKVETMQEQEDRRNDDVPCCRNVEAMQEQEDRNDDDVPCRRNVEAMQEQEDRNNDDVLCCREVEAVQEQEDRSNDDVPCRRKIDAMQEQEDRRNDDAPCCRKFDAMQEQEDRRNDDAPCRRNVEAMQEQEDRSNDDGLCCREVEAVEAMQEQEDRRNDDVLCCREVEAVQEQEDRRNDDIPCRRKIDAMQEQEGRRNDDVPCCRNVEAMQEQEDRSNDDVPCCREVEAIDAMQEQDDRRNDDVPCCRNVEAMREQEDRRNDDVPCCREVEAMQEQEDRRNDDVPCCRKIDAMQEQEDRRNDDVPCCRKIDVIQEQEDRSNDDVLCCRNVESMQEQEDRRNDDVPCSSNCLSSLDRLPTASTMTGHAVPNLVYRRKKLRKNSTVPVLKIGPMSVPASASCPLFISPCAHRLTLEHQPASSQIERVTEMVNDPDAPIVLCETAVDSSIPKNLGINSIYDSCSSSKSNMEIVSDSIETGVDDTGECSSSSVLVMDAPVEDLSAKDFCVKILRSHGLLGEDSHAPTVASQVQVATSGNSCSSRSCKICGHLDGSLSMLICDHCEEAHHPSCMVPRVKKLPIDEWFCHSCIKRKQKILKESIIRRSPTSEMELCRSSSVNGGLNPILLMLNDSEPSKSGVRVGKGFQAEVPEWSGPIGSDDDCAEPLEIGSSAISSLLEKNLKRSTRPSSIGNWLQCQEVVDRAKGTICGKWRRAPLFEVQTDNWECFCAIQWDPAHADCAVPQEVETDQVLKQLKYIEMLRPRLAAKRSKLDNKRGGE
ncbi:uncharacterized protein LOC114715054 isoform X2 [Neltuma alba]|uniref:uncharacterized protein LOC114715054 isoform X2 n=1 Tax=Neltuma alba TaxID=207710 RepID=UPI0010A56AF5|nr:uncharacterized protein LOC114715054 isoform X2 [Prosopis alba]